MSKHLEVQVIYLNLKTCSHFCIDQPDHSTCSDTQLSCSWPHFEKKNLNLACLYFRVLLLTQCACSCDGVEGIHLLADGLRSSQTGVHVCSTITVWSPSGKLSPLSSERSKGFFCQLTRSRVSYVISVWNKGHSDWMHEWVDCGIFPICKLA